MRYSLTLAVLMIGLTVSAQEPPVVAGIPPAPAVDPDATATEVLLSATDPVVTRREANSRRWQWTNLLKSVDGQLRQEVRGYIELADGLCYWSAEQGQFLDSEETVEILPDGAGALKGPIQVRFASDLHTLGAITITLPGGRRMVGHPLGLTYFDPVSGRRVLLAGLRAQCPGELHPPNVVVYPDAFAPTNGLRADVTYTYTRATLAQDLVLRSVPPDPRDLDPDLNPETTRLEIWTEWLETPAPTIGPDLQSVTDTGLFDFGPVSIGNGQAFPLPREADGPAMPVEKRWLDAPGENPCLIESVPWRAIQTTMQGSPQAALPKKEGIAGVQQTASRTMRSARLFPLPPPKAPSPDPMRLAALPPPDKGFALDYIITLNGSTNGVIFASDTTYYLSGTCTIGGNATVFEGGAVIKYTNGASLCVQSTNLDCRTSQYQPIVFTARNDGSIGEPIPGATGYPSNYYASPALRLSTAGSNVLQNLRIRYATTGVELSGTNNTISHLQLLKVQTGLKAYGTNPVQVALRNVLGAEMNALLSGTNLTASLEHLTLAKANYLATTGAAPAISLTNSLLVAVTNTGSYSGLSNQEVTSITGVFRSAGAGQYYPATNTPGTTNINAQLRADLAQRTTYPPTIVSNVTYTTNATLGPTVARDANNQTVGYHYDPIDYLLARITINGATLSLTGGAALAISDYSISFGQSAYSTFLSQGTPMAINRIVEPRSVQEQTGSSPPFFFTDTGATAPYPALIFRYTALGCMAGAYNYVNTGRALNTLELTHCQVSGGKLAISGGDFGYFFRYPICAWTNTLFERVAVSFSLGSANCATLFLRNNLFWRGSLTLPSYSTNNMATSFQNNLFDNLATSVFSTANSYNGYINTPVLPGSSGNDVTNAAFTYQAGPLGRYYQPTNSPLINAGSTSATNVGLCHFTTLASQVPEGTTTVDCGLHYVALDATGQPLDTDGDTLWDVAEDVNGNGLLDPALLETDWQTYTTITNAVPGLQVFTPMR